MIINLNNLKVVYEGRGINAVALIDVEMSDGAGEKIRKPQSIEILAIDEDGKIISIRDETKKFRFI